MFATNKKINKKIGLPITHHFTSKNQTKTFCGMVERGDNRYNYSDIEPVYGVPCQRCNYYDPTRYRG